MARETWAIVLPAVAHFLLDKDLLSYIHGTIERKIKTVTIKELVKQLQSIPKEYEDYGVRVLYNDIDEDTVDTFDPSENFWVDSVDVNDCRRLAKKLVIVGYRH